jgi:hypothetical protein
VLIDCLGIDRLTIVEGILGREAVFEFWARTGLISEKGAVRGSACLRGLEGTAERLEASWSLFPSPACLGLELYLFAPPGGFLSRASKIDPGFVEIRLQGSGPLDAWDGGLEISSTRLGSMRSDIHAGLLEEELLLEAEGTVEPGPGLGPEAMEAGPLSFSLSGSYDSRGRVSIRNLDLSRGDAAAELHGGIDLESSEVRAGLDLRVARLSGADVGLPYGGFGPLRLSADISGRASEPFCKVRISAESVDMPGLRVGSFSAVLAGELPLEALRSLEGLSVRAHGEAEALSFSMGDEQVAV